MPRRQSPALRCGSRRGAGRAVLMPTASTRSKGCECREKTHRLKCDPVDVMATVLSRRTHDDGRGCPRMCMITRRGIAPKCRSGTLSIASSESRRRATLPHIPDGSASVFPARRRLDPWSAIGQASAEPRSYEYRTPSESGSGGRVVNCLDEPQRRNHTRGQRRGRVDRCPLPPVGRSRWPRTARALSHRLEWSQHRHSVSGAAPTSTST